MKLPFFKRLRLGIIAILGVLTVGVMLLSLCMMVVITYAMITAPDWQHNTIGWVFVICGALIFRYSAYPPLCSFWRLLRELLPTRF